jgi:hypothetical protein
VRSLCVPPRANDSKGDAATDAEQWSEEVTGRAVDDSGCMEGDDACDTTGAAAMKRGATSVPRRAALMSCLAVAGREKLDTGAWGRGREGSNPVVVRVVVTTPVALAKKGDAVAARDGEKERGGESMRAPPPATAVRTRPARLNVPLATG